MGVYLALLVDDNRDDTEEREGSGARLLEPGTRQGGDHVATGLRLPPGVHDGAPLVTHHLKDDQPRL